MRNAIRDTPSDHSSRETRFSKIRLKSQQYIAIGHSWLSQAGIMHSCWHFTPIFEGNRILGRVILEPVKRDILHHALTFTKQLAVGVVAEQQAIAFHLADHLFSRPTRVAWQLHYKER